MLARVLAACLALAAPACAKTVLAEHRGSLRARAEVVANASALSNAVGEALGCGGHVTAARLAEIERALLPTWRALPKIADERVERQSLRYLAHRYFSKKASLLVRGFEPSRSWGATSDILSQRVPRFVESVLESRHAQQLGFDLQDAARVVATLEQLIFDAESTLLEHVYTARRTPTTQSLTAEQLGQLLEEYLVRWMMGDDVEGAALLLANRTFLASAFPHWHQLSAFVHGEVRALEFKRMREPRMFSRAGHHPLASRYSFEDAHRIVGGITDSFASFWESECTTMKATLLGMDPQGTGRVPLSRFYSSALDSEWRFGESEAYLREQGVLDESSHWRGAQLVIPNYVQAASNCIVSTPHYLVCCINDCDGLRAELEEAVQAPSAAPDTILAIVANMTSQTTLDHDDPPILQGTLSQQLQQIAELHSGSVPLHGRLFAQWLHYAFPRECAFPHRRGAASALTPGEFGSAYLATGEEMERHANSSARELEPMDASWMSQWSPEEELLVGELQAPWERRSHLAVGGAALVLLALGLGVIGWSSTSAPVLPTHHKSHFV